MTLELLSVLTLYSLADFMIHLEPLMLCLILQGWLVGLVWGVHIHGLGGCYCTVWEVDIVRFGGLILYG